MSYYGKAVDLLLVYNIPQKLENRLAESPYAGNRAEYERGYNEDLHLILLYEVHRISAYEI
jgi:hypothetical protein